MKPKSDDPISEGGPVATIGRPKSLGTFSSFGDDATALVDLLTRAGLSSEIPALYTLEGDDAQVLADWLDENADAHILVFWQSPVVALTQAMAQSQPPDQALKDWLAGAQQLLVPLRKNRRRITLAETTVARSNPGIFIERLNQRLALSLKMSADIAGSHEEYDPVQLLIAKHAVDARMQARRLMQELQATSLPIVPDEALLPDSLTAWQGYLQHTKPGRDESEQNQEQMRALKEENELLLVQLQHVQEELESFYLESRDLDKDYQNATIEIERLKKELDETKEDMWMHRRAAHYMRNSFSWRITRPLRALYGLFKRKNDSKNKN